MIRRGAEIQDIQQEQRQLIYRFKVGDIVTPYFAPANDFYGIVVDVNPVEDKVYVDFNGTVRQMDPGEIRLVLKYMLQKASNRRGSNMSKNIREAIYHFEKGRKYKYTRNEEKTGDVNCPKCRKSMVAENYAKGVKLYRCDDCGFKIKSDEIYSSDALSNTDSLLEDEFVVSDEEMFAELSEGDELKPELKTMVQRAIQLNREMKAEVGGLYDEAKVLKDKIKRIETTYKNLPTKKNPTYKGLNRLLNDISAFVASVGEEHETWEGIVDNAKVFLESRPSMQLSYQKLWKHALTKVNEDTRNVLEKIKDEFRGKVGDFDIKELDMKESSKTASAWEWFKGFYKSLIMGVKKVMGLVSKASKSYDELGRLMSKTAKKK